ncbi:MAG: sodium/proline symporter PutP [Clostridia bacterium]|nr:sodium/proline symporter PutP [Clostridia bacterium]
MLNFELLALIIYFVAMLGIGVFFFFKSKTLSDKDYFLGGRSMGPWVTAMSAQASDMSAWLLMGLPGSILAFGLGQAWIGIGLALGTALNWILVAKRLRRFSQAAGDSITLPQYLSNRFLTKKKTLQVVCAIVFLVCFTVYVASAFVAGANVFTSLFEIQKSTAMLIFAVILIIYTFLGGYKAVCWTDFFQGILMLIAVLAIPIIIVCTKELDTSVLSNTLLFNGTKYEFVTNIFAASPKEIINGLAWGLGYFGMPHILVRFMAIEKPSMVKTSGFVVFPWFVLSLGAVVVIAYFGRMLVGEELLKDGAQSMVFIKLSRILFPPFVSGILLSAIIAASMSTADSQLLVASSSFTSDIYKPIIRKKASDKETLWVGRAVVLVVAVVAYFIASSKGNGAQAIMNLVENAWAGFGSAFGPVVILSIFWRRFTYKGALAGVISGALVDVLWLIFLSGSTGIYELIPGFAVSMIVSIVVTLLDKKPSEEITAIFDAATKSENE